MAEIHQRTSSIVQLPQGEDAEIQLVSEKPFGAAHYYLGNYRSRIEVNLDALAHWEVDRLVDTLCHEGYPGHHVYAVLQEQALYRGRGYIEQAIPLVLTPQCVIGEGVAMLSCEMLFTPLELEEWLQEQIYPEVEIAGEWADVAKLRQAEEVLQGVWCNAAFMLHEGRSEQEVSDYLETYGQGGSLHMLKEPFGRIYSFSYVYGKKLLCSWLQGTDQHSAFRSLLTSQVVPSALLEPGQIKGN